MKSPLYQPILKFIFIPLAILLLSFASAFALQPAGPCLIDFTIDDRGDLNLNGVGHEIADAILYEMYFVYGDSVLSSDLAQRQAQIAASDINGDGYVLRVSDLVGLILVIRGDANPLPRANAFSTPATAQFQIIQTADSLVIYSNSPEAVRGVFLRLAFTGTMGNPVKLDSASSLDLDYNVTPSELRLLLYPLSGGRMSAGNWPILSIPFTGTLEHAEVQASDTIGFELPASVTGAPSAVAGQKPVASAPVISSSCADLIVETLSLSGPAPAPGDSIGLQLSAVIRNTGSVAVGDSFYISFLISQDSSLNSPFRWLVGGPVAVAGVPAGGSVNVAIPSELSIPIDYWPVGPGYLGIIADGLIRISECDELNNWAFTPISIEPPPASPTDSLIMNSVAIYTGQTSVSVPFSLTNSVPVGVLQGRIVFDPNLVAPKAAGFIEWVERGASFNSDFGLECSEAGAATFHRDVFRSPYDTIPYVIPPGSGIIGRLNLDILTTQDTILCIRFEDDPQPNGFRNLWYYPYYSQNLTFPTLKQGNLLIGTGNAAGACPQSTFKLGDLNLNGGLSPADVVLLLNCLFLTDTWDCPLYLTDINCDGSPTAADVVGMLNAAFLGDILSCP